MHLMPDNWPPSLDFLHKLIAQWECETVEFKGPRPGGHDVSQYVSALACEAFLASREYGWFVVGVDNKTHEIIGTDYKSKEGELDSLMLEIRQKTGYAATVNAHVLEASGKRVLIFRIAAAVLGAPVYSMGHAYGREGDHLCALPQEQLDKIRFPSGHYDWSARIVEEADSDDLDEHALQVARCLYTNRKPHLEQQIRQWNDMEFLDRLHLLNGGRLTTAALLLLGRREALHKTGLHNTEIRWILRDQRNNTVDYEHLYPPFLIAVDTAFGKIRNTMYRYMTNDGIYTKEVQRYDEYTLREAINNAVAHTDYLKDETIDVVEHENDYVTIRNAGVFLPGELNDVLISTSPCSRYRNACLAEAMVELNLIDKVGSGIQTMFLKQVERLFPVPDYSLADSHVQVTIQGKMLDYTFAFNLLHHNLPPAATSLLYDVFMNRRVEKKGANYLRSLNLITGRFPNIKPAAFLGEEVHDTEIGQKILNQQEMSKGTYIAHIKDILQDGRPRSRAEIMIALERHLPAGYKKASMERKISNILHDMQDNHILMMTGIKRTARWSIISAKRKRTGNHQGTMGK